jgi:hypothetical protein
MKNLVLVLLVVGGTTCMSYAQDGNKQTEPTKVKLDKTPQHLGTTSKKAKVKKTEAKKTEAPVKKIN